MNLPSLRLLVLHIYEELLTRNCTVQENVLYGIFCVFVLNCANEELI